MQLDPGTAYSLRQVADGVVIDLGNSEFVVLLGADLSSLPTGWIFEA